MYWLSFTPVEEHFYRRQHMDCSRDMIAQLNMYTSLETKLNSLDRHSFNKVANDHILRLELELKFTFMNFSF